MTFSTLDEVVALAKSVIGTADTTDELLFKTWCFEGLKDLGISEDSIKVCTLKPKNLIARKPDDFRYLIELNLLDSDGNQINHLYHSGNKRIYKDPNIFPTAVAGNTTNQLSTTLVDVSEDLYNIIIGTNSINSSGVQTVAAVRLRYFAYPIDETTGLPLIREDEKMALVYFCRFMWAMRKNDNRSEIDQNRNMWLLESDRVRAKKKLISPEEAKAIMKRFIRLIPDFNFQRF